MVHFLFEIVIIYPYGNYRVLPFYSNADTKASPHEHGWNKLLHCGIVAFTKSVGLSVVCCSAQRMHRVVTGVLGKTEKR